MTFRLLCAIFLRRFDNIMPFFPIWYASPFHAAHFDFSGLSLPAMPPVSLHAADIFSQACALRHFHLIAFAAILFRCFAALIFATAPTFFHSICLLMRFRYAWWCAHWCLMRAAMPRFIRWCCRCRDFFAALDVTLIAPRAALQRLWRRRSLRQRARWRRHAFAQERQRVTRYECSKRSAHAADNSCCHAEMLSPIALIVSFHYFSLFLSFHAISITLFSDAAYFADITSHWLLPLTDSHFHIGWGWSLPLYFIMLMPLFYWCFHYFRLFSLIIYYFRLFSLFASHFFDLLTCCFITLFFYFFSLSLILDADYFRADTLLFDTFIWCAADLINAWLRWCLFI